MCTGPSWRKSAFQTVAKMLLESHGVMVRWSESDVDAMRIRAMKGHGTEKDLSDYKRDLREIYPEVEFI
jgi:hypothetical protein